MPFNKQTKPYCKKVINEFNKAFIKSIWLMTQFIGLKCHYPFLHYSVRTFDYSYGIFILS